MYRTLLLTLIVTLFLLGSNPAAGSSPNPDAAPEELAAWSFLIGDWNAKSTRFSSEGEAIESSDGQARFSWALGGSRIQERLSTVFGGQPMEALNLFVVDPETGIWEVAWTDTIHQDFSVKTGTQVEGSLVLRQKNPDPESRVTRRWTYSRESDDRFAVDLEFSTDGGESYFVRNRTVYSRRH